MGLSKIKLENFTVFEKEEIAFSPGLNVIIGENGAGKTHLMKLLYAALQSADPKVSFPHKIVRCFQPDDYRIARLVRKEGKDMGANVKVSFRNKIEDSEKTLSTSFEKHAKGWNALIKGEDGWKAATNGVPSTYIPAKEILSNAYNLPAAVEKNNVVFDDTYLDIINSAKVDLSVGKDSPEKKKIMGELERIVGGKALYDANKDEFYLRTGQTRLEFPLLAEGLRKVALLWQLVNNGILKEGSVLFWDEPEANLNPANLPTIVDILLMMQRNGMQVFVTTHNYILSKYIDVRSTKEDEVAFLSLYKTDHGAKCERDVSFVGLKHNSIMDNFISLYGEQMDKVMAV